MDSAATGEPNSDIDRTIQKALASIANLLAIVDTELLTMMSQGNAAGGAKPKFNAAL
jgi:hypothetical protein